MKDIISIELEDIIFKKVNTLDEICAAANKNEDLKNGLQSYLIFNSCYIHKLKDWYYIKICFIIMILQVIMILIIF
jgi:hypothetical protein